MYATAPVLVYIFSANPFSANPLVTRGSPRATNFQSRPGTQDSRSTDT